MLKVKSKKVELGFLFMVCPPAETIVCDYLEFPDASKLPRGVIINCCPTDDKKSPDNLTSHTRPPRGRIIDLRRVPVPVILKLPLVKKIKDRVIGAATELVGNSRVLLETINTKLYIGVRDNKWKYQNSKICNIIECRRVRLYPIFNMSNEQFELRRFKSKYTIEEIAAAFKLMYTHDFSGPHRSRNYITYDDVKDATYSEVLFSEHSMPFKLADTTLFTLLILDVKLRDAIYATTGFDFSMYYEFDDSTKKYVLYVEVPHNETQ